VAHTAAAGASRDEVCRIARRGETAHQRDAEGGAELAGGSFIAEPAPARRAGTADMIDAVMGDIDIAIPLTRKAIDNRMYQYDVCGLIPRTGAVPLSPRTCHRDDFGWRQNGRSAGASSVRPRA